jgi:hypothetical protein
MQLYLAAAGIFQFFWMYAYYFPKTAQPGTRDIDKLPEIDSLKHPRAIIINLLRPLTLLCNPNLLFIVSCFFCLCPRKLLALFQIISRI